MSPASQSVPGAGVRCPGLPFAPSGLPVFTWKSYGPQTPALTTRLKSPVLCLCFHPSLHHERTLPLRRCRSFLTLQGDQLRCRFLQEALLALDLVFSVTKLATHGYVRSFDCGNWGFCHCVLRQTWHKLCVQVRGSVCESEHACECEQVVPFPGGRPTCVEVRTALGCSSHPGRHPLLGPPTSPSPLPPPSCRGVGAEWAGRRGPRQCRDGLLGGPLAAAFEVGYPDGSPGRGTLGAGLLSPSHPPVL